MKQGELCESCNGFSEGRFNVVSCPICKKDVCNLCGNLGLCPGCFKKYESGTLGYIPIYEYEDTLPEWEQTI